MEALHQLDAIPAGSLIAVDTAPLIFFLEDHPTWAETYAPLFQGLAEGRWRGVISTITLAEVLAGPLQQQRHALAERYEAELSNPTHWSLVPLNQPVASRAGRLRVRYGLKLLDAVQLSTAIHTNAAALITHNRDFSRCEDVPILSATH